MVSTHTWEFPLPVRARSLTLCLALVAAAVCVVPAAPARAAEPKVAIIVGPVGGLSDAYRSAANRVADAAAAAGATVAKAYSPNATWSKVKSAVNGANVIVYFGHGNGFPNPYSSTENTDRVNGWGLNRTTSNGDSDNWSTTMAYCGERAILGQLTSADDSVRRTYCGGTSNDGITPAPGFTMVYAQAHYAPGFGERYQESDPVPTLSEGQQRVRNYSYPMLALGARGYFATAYGDADDIVERVLTQPTTSYGELFRAGEGYVADKLKVMAHPDINGAEVWVQKTAQGSNMHFGDPDYWYAFAGDPSQTPDGNGGLPFTDIADSAFVSEIIWLADEGITTGCTATLFCPGDPVSRSQMATFLSRALALPPSSTDWFTDDDGLSHEDSINRLADAGITTGCGETTFCPRDPVSRGEMASFLSRALALPPSSTDWFTDDDGLSHEDSINRLADAGITTGCGGTRFCPSGLVTRQQMAAFLFRALGS
jgi:hypothetical protein